MAMVLQTVSAAKTLFMYKMKVKNSSYKNEISITDQSVQVEVVNSGTVFKGRIHFKKLTEEQLSLLMYSLGLNEKSNERINLKIGGFKNSGIGEVNIDVTRFDVRDLNKTPAALAGSYVNMATANKSGIAKINKILKSQQQSGGGQTYEKQN